MNKNSQARLAGWNIPTDQLAARNAVAAERLRAQNAKIGLYEATLRKEER